LATLKAAATVLTTHVCVSLAHAALELCVAGGSTSKSKVKGGGSSSSPAQKLFVSGTKAADVESFITSFSRNGFLAAPPDEFLALLTDWRSARTHSHAQPQ
jgi:hypothetical protein